MKESTRRALSTLGRGRDTKPELALRSALWKAGLRYRVNYYVKKARCHIDIAFPRKKIAIFVDGCFWHGCPACSVNTPRTPYWQGKILTNRARDQRQTKALQDKKWIVYRIWEHQLSDEKEIRTILHVVEGMVTQPDYVPQSSSGL